MSAALIPGTRIPDWRGRVTHGWKLLDPVAAGGYRGVWHVLCLACRRPCARQIATILDAGATRCPCCGHTWIPHSRRRYLTRRHPRAPGFAP